MSSHENPISPLRQRMIEDMTLRKLSPKTQSGYGTRGDLDEAEAMLKKSVELFQDVGAVPQVDFVQGWLDELRQTD